jgi:K+-transporting ATPase KdpF subunit
VVATQRARKALDPHDSEQGGTFVSWIYLIAAIVAAALFFYLLVALLKPEWFQ